MTSPRVTEVIERLQRLHPISIDLGLDRTLHLLEKLDNPQDKMPPIIHIAGTNGKGSTLSFLQSILESAGLRVHRYTSPELVRFNERYSICGKEISDDVLIDALEKIERVNGDDPITFFEITTTVAFTLFAEIEADIVLLETGLGGRLDSTNVVRDTDISVITSISIDHEGFLGDTVSKIAFEKAGIMRSNRPTVIAKQNFDEALGTLLAFGEDVGADTHYYGRDFTHVITDTGFDVTYRDTTYHIEKPALLGIHQYENASTAVAVCQVLNKTKGFDITLDHINRGMKNVVHRGRFEKLTTGLGLYLPQLDVYCDGGHNLDAGNAIKSVFDLQGLTNITLVFSMLDNKDCVGFITILKPYIKRILIVPMKNDLLATAQAVSPNELAKRIRQCGIDTITICDTMSQVVTHLQSDDSGTVLCAGSLHLVGQAIAYRQ